MADAITFVAAGVSSTSDGGSNLTPAFPTGITDDDLELCFFYSRENVDGSVAISSGWTEIFNERSVAGLMACWYRFYVSGDSAPTITLTNHTGGTSGDDALSQIAAWRGVSSSAIPHATGVVYSNTAATNIGPAPGCEIPRKGLAVVMGGKLDDYTSVATLSGDSLTWNEIAEVKSTAGSDAGMIWDYAINTGLDFVLSDYTFTVTGGTSVAGKSAIITFELDAPAFSASDHAVVYCATSHPLTDSGAPGGAIDPYMRAVFTDLAADDDLEVLSDNSADVGIGIYIKGRDSTGALLEEINVTNGTTAVIFSTLGVISQVEEVRLTSPAAGTITVRRSVAGATIGTIPTGELGFRRVFQGCYSHPTDSKDYYEKIFIKNLHPTLTITGLTISESSDPGSLVTFTLAASIDDTANSINRLTAPGASDTDPDTFDGTDKTGPNSANLDPGQAVGVWLKMTIAGAATASVNTYTLGVVGGTS